MWNVWRLKKCINFLSVKIGGDMLYFPSIIFGVSESTKLVKDETPTASLGSNHFYYCSFVLASRWIILHFITFYWRLMLVVGGGGWQQQHGNETSNNYIFQVRILGLKGEKLRGRNGIFYSIVSTFNILRERVFCVDLMFKWFNCEHFYLFILLFHPLVTYNI